MASVVILELQEIEFDIHMTKRSEKGLRNILRHDFLSLLLSNFDLFEEHHIPSLTKYSEFAHMWIEDATDGVTDGASPAEEMNNYVELAKQFLTSFDELVRRKEDTVADRLLSVERTVERHSICPHARTTDDWIDVDPERSVQIRTCDDCGATIAPKCANDVDSEANELNELVKEHLAIRCKCPSFRRTTGCCPPNPKWEQHVLTNCPLCFSTGSSGTSSVV